MQAGAKIVVDAAWARGQDRKQRPLAKAEVSAVRRTTTAHPRRTTTRTGARGRALSRAAQNEDSQFRITPPRRAVILPPPPPPPPPGRAVPSLFQCPVTVMPNMLLLRTDAEPGGD